MNRRVLVALWLIVWIAEAMIQVVIVNRQRGSIPPRLVTSSPLDPRQVSAFGVLVVTCLIGLGLAGFSVAVEAIRGLVRRGRKRPELSPLALGIAAFFGVGVTGALVLWARAAGNQELEFGRLQDAAGVSFVSLFGTTAVLGEWCFWRLASIGHPLSTEGNRAQTQSKT